MHFHESLHFQNIRLQGIKLLVKEIFSIAGKAAKISMIKHLFLNGPYHSNENKANTIEIHF